MTLRTGKKPARPDAVQLRFSNYFGVANLPSVPLVFGQPWLIRSWGMLGNDSYGDCLWAGAAHETMMLAASAGGNIPTFTSRTVLGDYAACTGFNPDDASTDEGTDVQVAAAYRQKTGILDILGNRHKIDVYTALRVGDLDELARAVFFLGAAGVGVRLPADAQDQFNMGEPWTTGGQATTDGHYISCIGRNSHGNFLFVSWGRLQAATPDWIRANMDEGLAFVSRDKLKTFDPAALRKLEDDYAEVTR